MNKYSSTFGKMRRNGTSLQHMFARAIQNPRTRPSRTSVKAVRNTIVPGADFLL